MKTEIERMHQDFSKGLTDKTFWELICFGHAFMAYAENIDELKNKFDWYYEQYNQMIECGETDFVEWLKKEVFLQMERRELHEQHFTSTSNQPRK